jgi:hypothetical protein
MALPHAAKWSQGRRDVQLKASGKRGSVKESSRKSVGSVGGEVQMILQNKNKEPETLDRWRAFFMLKILYI